MRHPICFFFYYYLFISFERKGEEMPLNCEKERNCENKQKCPNGSARSEWLKIPGTHNSRHRSLIQFFFISFNIRALLSATCPPPANIEHGSFRGSNFAAGDNVTYTCDNQYFLNGLSMITCLDGRWNGAPPICRGETK